MAEPLERHVRDVLVDEVSLAPPERPQGVAPEEVVELLDAHADALRALMRDGDLDAAERSKRVVELVGDLQQRTGIVLVDGRRRSCRAGTTRVSS
jgi:hypothetical protein